MSSMLESREFPRMFPARQLFDRPRVADIPGTVAQELGRLFAAGSRPLRPGAWIGITVGSRGIAAIDVIARAAVDFFKSRKARPFIIPAMGSHGGATPEGQKALLAHFGISEEAIGCPIRAEMSTLSLGRAEGGVEAYFAQAAWDSEGILLLNRIKAHTDFKGPIESGLAKVCAIGLGKLDGARECHGRLFDLGLGQAVRNVAELVLSTGKVLGGLAILENAYHETARLSAVGAAGLLESEEKLLREAKAMGASLPFDVLDLLICERIGKNISGAGFDTNVIGRGVYGYIPGVPWMAGMPAIQRIFVRDLAEESDGNGVGMGLADFTTPRMLAKVDHAVTQLNCFTSRAPLAGRPPIVLPNDQEAISAALSTCRRRPEGPLAARIQDTLHLHLLSLSEALLPAARVSPRIEVLGDPSPLRFDAGGWLVEE